MKGEKGNFLNIMSAPPYLLLIFIEDMKSYIRFMKLSPSTSKQLKFIASAALGATLYWQWQTRQSVHYANSYSFQLKRYSATAEYPNLIRHSNLMAKYLTPQLYAKLRDRITPSGFTIDDAIQVGIDNPGMLSRQYFGIVAGDEASYKIYSELFDPVIKARYNHASGARQYHDFDYEKLKYPTLDNDNSNKYILSSRIRLTRNLKNFSFPSFCTRGERRIIESKLEKCFQNLIQNDEYDKKYTGSYYRLLTLDERLQEKLVNDGIFLFKPMSMSWLSSGIARDWPDGRSLYFNQDKDFYAWINQKDHLRLISWSKNNSISDLKIVIKTLFDGLNLLETSMNSNDLAFAHDDHFGFLTTCPVNIGTGLKYNIYLKLPNLAKDIRLPTIIKELNLNMEEIIGLDDKVSDDCIDISNKDRIGKTEVEIIQHVLDSVTKLIEMEKKLESGEKLDKFFHS
ncbi:unnamed protein product [Didymodactylos carnosus]|uniref:Arginine kinase n=1 Tax=Didymodactylos carnosus TaxID=1234261 RepID=A0A8S2LNF3_9BILA|nr:unnamed protein product [Didymodactylos carnosus]CAF3899365.1 unnamed protein product [Didymodactylos carnosus]